MKLRWLIGLLIAASFAGVARAADSLLDVDYRKIVSKADLDYTTPCERSEEGMPIGNGRMGSLVWTTPSAIHFQINRCDVFAEDASTTSFPKQDSDYASGCGYVDINVAHAGDDVFAGKDFHQHLSCYDGVMTARGKGVKASVLAWPRHDVIMIRVEDLRENPEPIDIDLRMLRSTIQYATGKNAKLADDHAVEYHTAEHTARSDLDIRNGWITLSQQFTEHAFYDASAIAIAVLGRDSKAHYLNETTVQLSVAAGKGSFLIFISSAATFDSKKDVAQLAQTELEKIAHGAGEPEIEHDSLDWWHDFWSKSLVAMHDSTGQADFVQANYTYFLYLMASTSRGDYPPRFGGMLFYTNGDMRRWGAQYWWANTNAYYSNLMPANHMELMDPLFNMYSGMLPACELAAKQQWGSQGVWIPEITFFSGPEKLPDDIAAELQDLMLCRKPWEERSAKFTWWVETKNRHNARYNFLADGHFDHGHYVVPTKSASIFGHCTHILSDAARIGNLYYQRYLFTGDKTWLADRTYPIVKGAAEFYRNFPNVQKGADGKYHILHVNNGESSWDTNDTPNEINGIRTAMTLAIRVSTQLGVDTELRTKWQEVLTNLAPTGNPGRGRRPAVVGGGANGDGEAAATRPAPPGFEAGAGPGTGRGRVTGAAATRPGGGGGGGGGGRGGGVFGAFVYGGPGAIPPQGPDADQKRRFLGFNGTGSFIDAEGDGGAQIFRNRLRLREGPGAIDAEHLGGLTAGIHSVLLPSNLGTPTVLGAEAAGEEPTIEVFTSAWPRSWDCAFTLLARGGFLVSSAMQGGKIPFVQLTSQLGGDCRLHNPWGDAAVTLHRNGKPAEELSGATLNFKTSKGESIAVVPKGATPTAVQVN